MRATSSAVAKYAFTVIPTKSRIRLSVSSCTGGLASLEEGVDQDFGNVEDFAEEQMHTTGETIYNFTGSTVRLVVMRISVSTDLES